jgi:hypothetical protein
LRSRAARKCAEFLPFRNRALGPLTVTVLPVPLARRAATIACAAPGMEQQGFRCDHSGHACFLRYFSSTSTEQISSDSAGPFTSFDPVGFAIFATHAVIAQPSAYARKLCIS